MDQEMETNIIPALSHFITICNTSKNYDPEWNTNGLLMDTAKFIKGWMEKQDVKDLKV